MKRLSAVVVAACLASTLVFVSPAKAYHPDAGDLLFKFVSGDWYVFFVLAYSSEPIDRISGETPMDDCATGAPVEIERKKKTGWAKVLAGKTNKKAKFKKKLDPAKPGKYRAHILAYTTPDGVDCFEGYGDPAKFEG